MLILFSQVINSYAFFGHARINQDLQRFREILAAHLQTRLVFAWRQRYSLFVL